MLFLVFGLLLFLGTHSLRIAGDIPRERFIERFGSARFKILYTLASLLGFVMLVYGFGVARDTPVLLWTPPPAMKHAAYLFTLVAMVLTACDRDSDGSIVNKGLSPLTRKISLTFIVNLLAWVSKYSPQCALKPTSYTRGNHAWL